MSEKEKTFREELDKLIEEGDALYQAIQEECNVKTLDQTALQFRDNYQQWYSLTLEIIKHILPNRLDDFKDHYQRERKGLDLNNYRIDNFCNKRQNFLENNYVIPFATAIPHLQQQLGILKAAKEMLSSKLLDLKALVQADLFDSEIDVAKELAKKVSLELLVPFVVLLLKNIFLLYAKIIKLKLVKNILRLMIYVSL